MTTRVLLVGFELAPASRSDELLKTIRIRRKKDTNELFFPVGFRVPTLASTIETVARSLYEPRSTFLESDLPTVYDYHIVVLSKEAVYHFKDLLTERKEDFVTLMWAPFQGTLVVPLIGGSAYYESWVPAIDGLKQRDGDSLKPREKHWAYPFMKKYQSRFTWKAHANYSIASYNEEQAKRYIATNIADNPISFEFPLGNGRIVYLPFYNFAKAEEESLFLRDLLDHIQNRYKAPEEEVVPSWASKPAYRLPSEEEIERNARMVEEEKASLNKIKAMLWLDGAELVSSVAHTLTKLGIRCEVKEKEGKHDIEILEPELHAVVEVKGSNGYANDQHIRQLLDWQVEAEKGDGPIKGIFILNDFRDVEPELRTIKMREKVPDCKSPFTKQAERIANNNQFCLLTAYQLFQIFKQSTSSNFNKLDFVKKLNDTNGVFPLAT